MVQTLQRSQLSSTVLELVQCEKVISMLMHVMALCPVNASPQISTVCSRLIELTLSVGRKKKSEVNESILLLTVIVYRDMICFIKLNVSLSGHLGYFRVSKLH